MIARLTRAANGERNHHPLHLASGATHDTSAMAGLCPVGMRFTTCRDGLSHHPDEDVTKAAMSSAIMTLTRFLTEFHSGSFS